MIQGISKYFDSKNLIKEITELNFYDPKVNKEDILKEFQRKEMKKKLIRETAFGCQAPMQLLSLQNGNNLIV